MNTRNEFINFAKSKDVVSAFHYQPLHSSKAGKTFGESRGGMQNSVKTSKTLARIPLYYGMNSREVEKVVEVVTNFLKKI
jgi:dTDP-4-amino-4,6-dideoxygalactose transaminase